MHNDFMVVVFMADAKKHTRQYLDNNSEIIHTTVQK